MFDTEKFICEIEKRPALYDIRCKEYGNREIKAKCWFDVGAAVFPGWNELSRIETNEKGKELIKKWKALRDCFVKDYRKQSSTVNGEPAPKKKRYVYFDQLQFLLPFVGVGKEATSTSLPIVEEGETKDENVQEDDHVDDGEPESGLQLNANQTAGREKPCKKRNITKPMDSRRPPNDNVMMKATKTFTDAYESASLQMEDKTNDRFGNKAFLISFLPVMNSLPLHLQIEARLKMAELFKELISANVPSTSCGLSEFHRILPPCTSTPKSEKSYISDTSTEDLNISD